MIIHKVVQNIEADNIILSKITDLVILHCFSIRFYLNRQLLKNILLTFTENSKTVFICFYSDRRLLENGSFGRFCDDFFEISMCDRLALFEVHHTYYLYRYDLSLEGIQMLHTHTHTQFSIISVMRKYRLCISIRFYLNRQLMNTFCPYLLKTVTLLHICSFCIGFNLLGSTASEKWFDCLMIL